MEEIIRHIVLNHWEITSWFIISVITINFAKSLKPTVEFFVMVYVLIFRREKI